VAPEPETAELLAHTPVFQDVPLDGLTSLAAQGSRRVFAAQAVLMRQGDPADCMHVIVRGQVRVTRSHPALTALVLLAELSAGETVGEMGVLDGDVRSATATAVEETETLEIRAEALSDLLLRFPGVATALLRLLSKRIRNTNQLIERSLTRQSNRPEGRLREERPV
jgi:CRP-like cAMP-binding protein